MGKAGLKTIKSGVIMLNNNNLQVYQMACNHSVNPIGIDALPKLSWKVSSDKAGDEQVAYRLYVASSMSDMHSEVYIYDSQKVQTDRTVLVELQNFELKPRQRYFWKVEVYNTVGDMCVSPVSFFETSKLGEKWSAKWIGAGHIKKEDQSHGAPYLRKRVIINKKVKDARLYICGLGYYIPFVEGVQISNAMLEPAYTKYDRRVYYSVYDVAQYIKGDEFVLGAMLGNGWYNYFELDEWNTKFAPWKALPRLIAELHLTYADGATEVICSDSSWKSCQSPIVYNCIRNGETYDAALEKKGWGNCDFDDSDWDSVTVVRSPGGELCANQMEHIEITKEIETKKLVQTAKNKWIFDFGQNMAGVARLSVTGEKGATITMKYAEALSDDGKSIDNSHIDGFVKSGDFQTAKYIIGESNTKQEWNPVFTYYGFRYVELTCDTDIDVAKDTLTACVMHTAFERTAFFNCSDSTLNAIQNMCHWSTVSNVFGIPTDCPHREKNSWTGDSSIVSEQTLINFNAAKFFKKWHDDICDAQRADGAIPCIVPSPGWGYNWGNGPDFSKAIAEVANNLYMYTADKSILKKAYPHIKKCFDSMMAMAEDNIVDYGIGDWSAPFEGRALAVNMASFKASRPLVCTAAMYYVATVLSKCERLLGYQNTHKKIAESIKTAIVKHFINAQGIVEGDCQTSYALALYFKFADEETMLANLVDAIEKEDFHIDYGLLGSKYVLQGLGQHQRADVIYKMLTKSTFPSYKYLIDKGRTTLAECWNGTGSQNHYMYSDVSAVFYKYIAGIQVCEEFPAFKKFTIRPQLFAELDSLNCEIDTIYGKIAVKWQKLNNVVTLFIKVPFGTSATIELPHYAKNIDNVKELKSAEQELVFNI